MTDIPVKNWIPYELIKLEDELLCKWLNTFDKPFTEPFFEETILKCKGLNSRHSRLSSVSSLTFIKEWSKDLDAMEPAAFIFHISRCGSTLVSQLLAASDQHIVVSEAPFFDKILSLPYKMPGFGEETVAGLLAASIKFYGQKKNGRENRLFIKTDSWHLFFHKQLREIYPTVPFILIYRRPGEVFASHQKIKGMQAVPGLIDPQIFGFKPDDVTYNNLDLYLANVLERYLLKIDEIIETDNNCLLLNYNEGAMPMMKKIAAVTNTVISDEYLSMVQERSRYHSKKPGEVFLEDGITNAPGLLDNCIGLYDMLEEKRLAGR